MNQKKIGAILNYIVIFLNTLVGLIYTPYMLRMMGQSEYGLYSLVASIIGYLTILDLGFGNTIVRYTAKYRAENKVTEQYKMFGMFFILYFFIGVIAFLAGLILYFNVDHLFGKTMTASELERAQVMILILIFNLGFTFPMSLFGSIMNAYERFVFPKIINIIRICLNTAIMIILLSMGYKAIAMVTLMTIFNVITLVINFIYCRKVLHIKMMYCKFDRSFLAEASVYSLWIFLGAIIDKVYWSSGQFVLGTVVGTVAVSVYAVAMQLQSMYIQFSTSISSVFLPKVTSMVTMSATNEELSELFIRMGRVQNIVITFILFGFIVFGAPFINLWAGKAYSNAYFMTLLFLLSLYVPLIQNMGIIILQARNQMKFRCLLYIVLALLALVFEVVLANKWGGIGCAIAVSTVLLLGQGFIMNIYYHHVQHLNIIMFWREIIRMNFIPLVLTAVSWYVMKFILSVDGWLMLGISVILFSIIYFSLMISFSMNSYERNLFVNPVIIMMKKGWDFINKFSFIS